MVYSTDNRATSSIYSNGINIHRSICSAPTTPSLGALARLGQDLLILYLHKLEWRSQSHAILIDAQFRGAINTALSLAIKWAAHH